jgi:hypothetical protein
MRRRALRPVSLLTAVVWATATACAASAEDGSQERVETAPEVSVQQSSADVCDFAPVRPSYLPWVPPGEPVQDPSESISDDPESDLAGLYWTKERGERPYYVQLVRWSFDDSGSLPEGRNVPFVVAGVEGTLSTGGTEGEYPGFAEIQWSLPQARCNDIRLWLKTSGRMTDPEAAEEAIKIAKSFEAVDLTT